MSAAARSPSATWTSPTSSVATAKARCQFGLVVVASDERGVDLAGLPSCRQCARGVADRQQRLRYLGQRRRLAEIQVRRDLPGTCELVLERPRAFENVFDQGGGNSNTVAKPLRQVEDQLVRSVSSSRKCAFGALALLARYSLLLNGDATLPIGEARKSKCDDEAGGKTSGQDIAAAGCSAAALTYERLRFLRRCRCVARTRGDPAFGLFQSWRAQQQAARTTGRRPVVRAFTVLGVVSDPVNISAQRFCEPFGALFEFGRIVKEDKIQPPQGLGRGAVIDVPTHDRCEPLVQGGCVLDLLERLAGSDGVRREYEHDRIGLRDKRLQPLPPILEGVDLGAVDQRLESARFECLVEIVHEGHVSARIRNEDFGLRLAFRRHWSAPQSTGELSTAF